MPPPASGFTATPCGTADEARLDLARRGARGWRRGRRAWRGTSTGAARTGSAEHHPMGGTAGRRPRCDDCRARREQRVWTGRDDDGLIEMVTSFGARIEQFTPSDLMVVFGIEPMEDAARRAVLGLARDAANSPEVRGRQTRPLRDRLGSYLIARAGAVTGMDAHARRQATDVVNGPLAAGGSGRDRRGRGGREILRACTSRWKVLADCPSNPARIVGRERPRLEAVGRRQPLSWPLRERGGRCTR